MIIQKLLFPKEEICDVKEMYFRQAGSEIKAGQTISLETYFNAFSIGKWKEYTILDNLSLSLIMNAGAEFEIKAYHAIGTKDGTKADDVYEDDIRMAALSVERVEIPCQIDRESTRSVSVDQKDVESTRSASVDQKDVENTQSVTADTYRVSFPELPSNGIIYIEIHAISDCQLLGGAYETEVTEDKLNPVELVLGICTFKREEFLKRNVGIVLDSCINNSNSPLYGHTEIYISDNGQTLPTDLFQAKSNKVHIFPNKNAGGAGGFTRTMIESLFRRENSPFTHIILMDDDIVLSPDVLERTYNLLRLIRPEHKDMMVGGEMFKLDERSVQFEAGAKWHGATVNFYNKLWDMKERDCVACNEIPNDFNYSGWWYSCIPTSIINENNLPVPLFIHYDDMEYGVRNNDNGTILINGIAVWHPQGVGKAQVRMFYYDIRNMMICMSGLPSVRTNANDTVYMLMQRVIGAVIRYRYEEAEVLFEALEDFYKGPEWFMQLDPIAKHAELAKYNYKFQTPKEAGVDLSKMKNVKYKETFGEKLEFLWALLLWLLPSFRKMRVCSLDDIGLPFSAKKEFHYDENKGMGHMTEKSYSRAWKDFLTYRRVVKMIRSNQEEMMDRWAAAKSQYTSLDFWMRYLEL